VLVLSPRQRGVARRPRYFAANGWIRETPARRSPLAELPDNDRLDELSRSLIELVTRYTDTSVIFECHAFNFPVRPIAESKLDRPLGVVVSQELPL